MIRKIVKEIKYLFEVFTCGIKNLITWFPIIWADRQWDYRFFYEILYKKVLLLERHHIKYNPFTSKERTLKKMKICKLLCERLLNNNYIDNAMILHKNEWDKVQRLSEYTEKQDRVMLFKILEKEINRWWI